MKGKSTSQTQFQSKKWVFIPELELKPEPRGTVRAASQLSTALQSAEKAESVIRHVREASVPLFEPNIGEEVGYKPDQFVIKRTEPLKPAPPDFDHLDPSAPITSMEGQQQVSDTLAKATQRAHEFIVKANQPSTIFQRFSSLPPVTSVPQFPKTLEVLRYKETRRQGYKEPSPPPAKKKQHRRIYHSAWYLPPSHWKVVSSSQDTNSKYSLQRGTLYSAKAPYFFLHAASTKSSPRQFQENVKKFQRMPMMGRFKNHLEVSNLRIPPFLQKVKSERDFEAINDDDTISSSDVEA